MAALPIDVDGRSPLRATLLELSHATRMTAYDACYLELARRRGLAIATNDAAIRRSVRELKIGVL